MVLEAQALTNLLEETKAILKEHNLKLRNIKYVLISTGYIPVADFIEQAHNINYNAGYGLPHIDPSLKIVGATWWLSRVIYDGHEKWGFYKKPQKPALLAIEPSIFNSTGYNY